jgi:branched-subunit amino acid transport protein AzlD
MIDHNGRHILVDVVESLLCYEYARNGNLDKCIFGMGMNEIFNTLVLSSHIMKKCIILDIAKMTLVFILQIYLLGLIGRHASK